jgi:hypothetical protein
MGQIITTYPGLPASSQVLTLGGTRYRLRLTWRERLGAWYADLWTQDGAEVWLGQRVSAKWALGAGLVPEGAPEGLLLVRGPDLYRREDLGRSLKLVFYPDAELPEASADALEITVST